MQTMREGSSSTFTVTLSAPSSTATTISYSFGGTADGGSDFTNTTDRKSVAEGKRVDLGGRRIIKKRNVEASEDVNVMLVSVTAHPQITMGTTTVATGTINNNDSATVSVQ